MTNEELELLRDLLKKMGEQPWMKLQLRVETVHLRNAAWAEIRRRYEEVSRMIFGDRSQ